MWAMHIDGLYCKEKESFRLMFMSMEWDYISEMQPPTGGSIVHLLGDEHGEPRWIPWTGENRRTRRKSCPTATLSITNPTRTNPGANSDLLGERPMTDRLSHVWSQDLGWTRRIHLFHPQFDFTDLSHMFSLMLYEKADHVHERASKNWLSYGNKHSNAN
jgi:hypothetical protein